MAKEVVSFDSYSFSFPITTEDEVCKDSWGDDITEKLKKIKNNDECKEYLDIVKNYTTYGSCKIEGAIELSTVAEKITKELESYEADVEICITEVNKIIKEQKAKDNAIVLAYKKVKAAKEAYNKKESDYLDYDMDRYNAANNPEDKTAAALRDESLKEYNASKKAYENALADAKSKFSSAKSMPPSIGYDDLTMSG